MARKVKNATTIDSVSSVVEFIDSIPTYGEMVSRIVSTNFEQLRKLGELCGYDEESNTLRDNRTKQVTTDKLLTLLREEGMPRWNANIASVYVRTNPDKLAAIVNGGNTFRAMFSYCKENPEAYVPFTLSYSPTVDFGHFDQIQAKRTSKSNLELRFQDGYATYYNELFGLSCVRTKGRTADGGGATKRTWEGVVYYADQIANSDSTMFDIPWFDNLYNFGIAESFMGGIEHGVSLMSIGETLYELLGKKFTQVHVAYLVHCVLDCIGVAICWDTDDNGKVIATGSLYNAIEAIQENLDSLVKLLQPVWNPTTKGATFKADAKYSALCHAIYHIVNGKALPKVLKVDYACPLGTAQAYTDFQEDLNTEGSALSLYYST